MGNEGGGAKEILKRMANRINPDPTKKQFQYIEDLSLVQHIDSFLSQSSLESDEKSSCHNYLGRAWNTLGYHHEAIQNLNQAQKSLNQILVFQE